MIREQLIEALKNRSDDSLKFLLLASFQNTGEPVEGTLKERVFESVLQRFEAIEFARPFLKDHNFLCPKQFFNAFDGISFFLESMKKEIGDDFPEAGKLALIGVFVKLYPVFLEDTSPDLSALMSQLDQILNSLQPFVNLFMFNVI
jgi:hypothetical protein